MAGAISGRSAYEPLIRRAAGLGPRRGAPDPDHYEKAYAHCDVLVIGAGPAGLVAALAAGRAGARVILCEEDFRLGGRLLSERYTIDGKPGVEWAAGIEAELATLPDVRIMRRTAVTGVFDHGQYAAIERVNDHVAVPPDHQPRQRYWKIVAKRAVLAAGALERPIAFGNNDRPGVMLAGAAAHLHQPLRGRAPESASSSSPTMTMDGAPPPTRIAVGLEVAAVIDSRADAAGRIRPPRRQHPDRRAGIACSRAIARPGGRRSSRMGAPQRSRCDALAVSGGWNPAVHLTCHLGGKPVWNDALAAFVPGTLPPDMIVAGAATGAFDAWPVPQHRPRGREHDGGRMRISDRLA